MSTYLLIQSGSSQDTKGIILINMTEHKQEDLEKIVKEEAAIIMEKNRCQYMYQIWDDLIKTLVEKYHFSMVLNIKDSILIWQAFAGSNLIKAE